MPKNAPAPQSTLPVTSAAPQDAAEFTPPRLGDVINVKVADGISLVNNETGLDFEPNAVTPQTVTVLTLRRLQDGDLVRV